MNEQPGKNFSNHVSRVLFCMHRELMLKVLRDQPSQCYRAVSKSIYNCNPTFQANTSSPVKPQPVITPCITSSTHHANCVPLRPDLFLGEAIWDLWTWKTPKVIISITISTHFLQLTFWLAHGHSWANFSLCFKKYNNKTSIYTYSNPHKSSHAIHNANECICLLKSLTFPQEQKNKPLKKSP